MVRGEKSLEGRQDLEEGRLSGGWGRTRKENQTAVF